MTASSYAAALIASTVAIATSAAGQAPALPVLQNAFLNPGLGFAANVGGGSGQSFYGVAAGWGVMAGRLQVSGAAGVNRANEASRGAYGGRAAFSVWSSRGGSIGAAAFAGIGGAPRTRSGNTITNPAVLTVPAGVSVAYLRPLGTRRSISVHASPFYAWSREEARETTSGGTFRVGLGADFSVTPSIGVTAGGELGGKNAATGKSGGLFGLAVTFVPGRR